MSNNTDKSHYTDLREAIEETDSAGRTADPEFGSDFSGSSDRPRRKNNNDIWSEILSFIKILIVAAVIAFLCNKFVIVNAIVPTGSMKNTIMEGDRLIGFRFSYLFSEPERGDIIIFKFPDDENETYVKRLIGIPGDIVEIMKDADGNVHVYINGEMIDEPYLKEPMLANSEYQKYIVPADHYFVMGDNRNSSTDARYWDNKYIARDKILAKAIFKYYKNFEKLS